MDKRLVIPLAIFYVAIVTAQQCPVLKPEQVDIKSDVEYKVTDDALLMCSEQKCEKLALADVQNAYPDAFKTQEEAEKTTSLKYIDYVTEVPKYCYESLIGEKQLCWFWSDRDRCCETWKFISWMRNPMVNTAGRRCYIIQMPYRRYYQYTQIGICGRVNRCRRCVQQYRIQPLLAWCPGYSGLQWHYFKIPSYCSCQE